MAPFRFAVQVSKAASPAAWKGLARQIEDLGYSTLYIPDHLEDQWAPMIALTVAAEATTTLRVGTLVQGRSAGNRWTSVTSWCMRVKWKPWRP